jgi:hypothetical protein
MKKILIVDLQMLDKQAEKCHRCSMQNNNDCTTETSFVVDVAYASIVLQKFQASRKQVRIGPVKF